MSDALLMVLAVGAIAAIQSIINAMIARKAAAQNAEIIAAAAILNNKLDETDKKVDVVEKKLDENHEQQNGTLTKLLDTTKQLATAQERARNDAADGNKKKA